MPTILSAANSAALSVLSVNDSDILKTQSRITTGLEVATASDDPVRYFRALDLTRRASKLSDVVKNIELAATAIKAADTTMTSMRSTLDSLLKTINEAKGTATGSAGAGAPATITGRAFAATSSWGKIGALLGNATAAEAITLGKSLQDYVRSKLVFDTNGSAANTGTASADGNLGLAPAAVVGVQITVGGQTLALELDAQSPSGKDLTVGDLVDRLNAELRNSADPGLQSVSAMISNDGRLRISSTTNQNVRVSFATGNASALNYTNGPANANFGFIAADAITGFAGQLNSPYDASMIGTTLNTLQEGDTFSIGTTDKVGNKVSFVFQASATKVTNGPNAGTTNNPIKFTTVGDLIDAINSKFAMLGSGNRITADALQIGTSTGLRMILADSSSALSIQQIQNVDATNYSTSTNAEGRQIRTAAANELNTIFGVAAAAITTSIDPALTDVYGAGPDSDQVIYSQRQQLASATIGATAAAGTAADPKRAAAGEAFKAAMTLIDRMYTESKLTTAGLPNLLNQEQLAVNLGDVNYSVQLSAKLDRTSLGLAPTTLPTFATDIDVNNFTATITSAITTITTQQGILSQSSTALSAYSGFASAMSSINANYADNLTRADVDAESNKLKALQTMQQLAQAVMSINNTLDANTVRLLY